MILTSLFLGLLLCLSRMSGFFVILPIFGSRNVPPQLKVGLVFFTSYVILPLLDLSYIYSVSSLLEVGYLVLIEFITGLSIGFVVVLLISCVYLAGTIIDRDIGFSMVSVIDPVGSEQMPVSANIFYMMSLMIFLAINGHHQLIRTLVETFEYAPVGRGVFNMFIAHQMPDVLQTAFVLGFKLAAPFVVTVFVGNILLGLLAKAMPGMNVFMLGMPFKILIGFILFVALVPYYAGTFIEVFEWLWGQLMQFMVYLR